MTLALTLAEVALHVREPEWLRAVMSETGPQDAGPARDPANWPVEIADTGFVAYRAARPFPWTIPNTTSSGTPIDGAGG